MERRKFLGMVSTAGLLTACGPRPVIDPWPFHVGDLIRCGWFSFNVLEVARQSQFGELPLVRQAKDGFLLIRLQATSSAGEAVSIPFLQLTNFNEDVIREIEDATELPDWFGILRRVDPGSTETGWMAFDAPPAVYALRLSDGVLDNEQIAMVRIPFQPESVVRI